MDGSDLVSLLTVGRHKRVNRNVGNFVNSALEEKQWSKMNFCEAEALLLLFFKRILSSIVSEFYKRLKVLIVFNHGSKRNIVKNLPALSSLTQLKTLRLERLNVLPFQDHSKVLQNLEKLSLRVCEGFWKYVQVQQHPVEPKASHNARF